MFFGSFTFYHELKPVFTGFSQCHDSLSAKGREGARKQFVSVTLQICSRHVSLRFRELPSLSILNQICNVILPLEHKTIKVFVGRAVLRGRSNKRFLSNVYL